MKKILSIILAVIMIFSSMTTSAYAADEASDKFKTTMTNFAALALGKVVETLIGTIDLFLSENDSFKSEEEYVYDNFYEGTAEFISEAKEGANWSLGHSTVSLVPENYEDYSLYLGGFMSEQNLFTNDVRMVLDDMAVRVIALSDGSGRGTTVFATVDAIGVSGGDVRYIRGLLSDFAKEKGINSINIFSTHCHSCIDTQGMWTEIFKKWPRNLISSFLGKTDNQLQGTDEEYMEFFYGKIKGAIEEAVNSMETGEMIFERKDIGAEYFNNKNRESASALDTELKKFTFLPHRKSATPTIILNMSAHPDVAGLATGDDVNGHGISGDYVYYIGETLNKAGYNFMFFNGAICGIYIGRVEGEENRRVDISANYGRVIGKMVLDMQNGKKVEPILNIRLKKTEIEITNPLIIAAGKINLVNHLIKVKDGDYFLTTEIGYMEIGKDIKIAMVPGEFCTDLAFGGSSLTAEGSARGKAFEGKTLAEIFGEDIIVFGLANDAVGYIVPDNDYAMSIAFGHYAETLSLGQKTASTLLKSFEDIR